MLCVLALFPGRLLACASGSVWGGLHRSGVVFHPLGMGVHLSPMGGHLFLLACHLFPEHGHLLLMDLHLLSMSLHLVPMSHHLFLMGVHLLLMNARYPRRAAFLCCLARLCRLGWSVRGAGTTQGELIEF